MRSDYNTINISNMPKQTLGDREITVQGPLKNLDIVKFKYVPLQIPDLELVHLVRCFGGTIKEGAQVVHETVPLTNPTTGEEVQLKSDTRALEATFPPTAGRTPSFG